MIETNINFERIRAIGNEEGKNSETFLAKDIQLNAEFIVKSIPKNKFSNANEYFAEARMLYDCRHINIAKIQYASEDENNIYFSMPYYKNGSLSKVINNRYLTVREIVKYTLDLLSGVAYIHSKGLIHLDIKPTNVLIDDSNRAVLTDFGLSRYLDENGVADQLNNYILTLDPEYFSSSGRTVLSDIYQVGLTLYRLCNGNNVLREQFNALNPTDDSELKEIIVNGSFPDRNYFLPHIPNKMRSVIKKALKVNTNERYNNVIEMMNDISEIEENLDWVYTNNPSELYYLNNGNNKIAISTINKSGMIEIKCTKENIKSGRKTNMNKYCSSGHTSNKEVSEQIANILKENK